MIKGGFSEFDGNLNMLNIEYELQNIIPDVKVMTLMGVFLSINRK